MALQCGIVGLPNVGKSTLFNALTDANIAAENFPFCTIEPNTGLVKIPDVRLDKIAAIVSPEKVVHSTMEFVDIAGLVEGASKGEGKGNKFLSHIRETSAVVHVVRCFEDENITHVRGDVSPQKDTAVINAELLLADLEVVERAIEKNYRQATAGGDKSAALTLELMKKLQSLLESGLPIRKGEFSAEEHKQMKSYNFITLKPMLYLANVDEQGFENNPHLDALKKIAKDEASELVVMCNQYEAELVGLSKEEKQDFLKEIGQEETGLDRFIRASFSLLSAQSYFTAGKKEVRAWTVKKGSTAPQAAGVIHTDFERGFIRAEVIHYDDYIELGGEVGAKNKGKASVEGKNYIIQDGDIVHFRFNV